MNSTIHFYHANILIVRLERMNIMSPWNFSPFNKETMQKLKRMRPEEVQNYVNEVMGKMFPPEMQGMNFAKGFNLSLIHI